MVLLRRSVPGFIVFCLIFSSMGQRSLAAGENVDVIKRIDKSGVKTFSGSTKRKLVIAALALAVIGGVSVYVAKNFRVDYDSPPNILGACSIVPLGEGERFADDGEGPKPGVLHCKCDIFGNSGKLSVDEVDNLEGKGWFVGTKDQHEQWLKQVFKEREKWATNKCIFFGSRVYGSRSYRREDQDLPTGWFGLVRD